MEIFIDPTYTPPKLQTQSKGSNSIVLGTKTELDDITLKRGDQIDIKVTVLGIEDITAIKFGSRRSDKLADNLLILAESSTPIIADGNTSFDLTVTIHTESLTDAFGLDTAKPMAQLSCLSEFVWVDHSGTMRVSESLPTSIVIDVIREDYPVYEDTASGDLINTAIATHTENAALHVSEADRTSWDEKITPSQLATALAPYASTANLATHTNDTTAHITDAERQAWNKIESVAQTALGECALLELSSSSSATITIPYKGCVQITGAISSSKTITIKGDIPPILNTSSDELFLWEGYLVFFYAEGSITFTNATCAGLDELEANHSYLLHIRVPAPAVAADIDMPYIKYIATIVAKGSGLDWEAVPCHEEYVLPRANSSTVGGVTISDSYTSYTYASSGVAASPRAVKYAYDRGTTAINYSGYPSSLQTKAKTNLVAAINELVSGAIASDCPMADLASTAPTAQIPFKGCFQITGVAAISRSITVRALPPATLADNTTSPFLWEGFISFAKGEHSISFSNVEFASTPEFIEGHSYLIHLRIPMPCTAGDLGMPYIRYIGEVVAYGSGLEWQPISDGKLPTNSLASPDGTFYDSISPKSSQGSSYYDDCFWIAPSSMFRYFPLRDIEVSVDFTISFLGTNTSEPDTYFKLLDCYQAGFELRAYPNKLELLAYHSDAPTSMTSKTMCEHTSSGASSMNLKFFFAEKNGRAYCVLLNSSAHTGQSSSGVVRKQSGTVSPMDILMDNLTYHTALKLFVRHSTSDSANTRNQIKVSAIRIRSHGKDYDYRPFISNESTPRQGLLNILNPILDDTLHFITNTHVPTNFQFNSPTNTEKPTPYPY